MVSTSLTVQDIITVPNKLLDKDIILPFIILPVLMMVATISFTITIVVIVAIGMGVLYVYSRPRHKNRSPFFFSWTLSSVIFMFIIFEYVVLQLYEITQAENFLMLLLMVCTCYFFRKMKSVAEMELSIGLSRGKEYSPILTSDSYYCYICQIEVNGRFFHSIWWDCCVFRPNYPYFLAGQVFALATLLHGTNLGLTTVCQPFVFYGSILMPKDCSNVYNEFELSICFVACIYGLGYVFVILLVLTKQLLVYIPKYIEPHWRKVFQSVNH